MSSKEEATDQIVQVIRMVEQAQALEKTIIDLVEEAISAGGPEPTLAQKIKPIDDELTNLRLEISKICSPQGTMGAVYAQTLISQLENMSKSWLSLFEQFGALRENSDLIIRHLGKIAMYHEGITKEGLAQLLEAAKMDIPGWLSEGSE
ncbi:hypothetical protein FIE12Z_3596 [Fusarium flagelliforme]|uniref:Uncharacterized protein n=1 Tax=Fusarium flagelliforme TaxID=2675880 RepID=A0A395MVY3_9HYPO|nr:hypothetical protein FIE12Z_3596 [Fusarium flagelliforme]